MKRFNLHFIFIFALLASCASVKESIDSRKKNSDEFLVEKKSPLLMPPNYNDLPKPGSEDSSNNDENNQVKELITKSSKTNNNSKKSNNSKYSFEKRLMEKMKN